MPIYTFRDKDTGNQFDVQLKYEELQDYKRRYSYLEQVIVFPSLHSGRGMGKIDSGFRDVLKEIKKNHSKGLHSSTVNVEGN